jgi:Na+-driven multidrug efflux pump
VPTAVRCLHVISYGYAFYAWGMVITQSFNGAGDTVTPLWINLFCFWVLQVPLAYLLAFGTALGIEGIFWAVCASETISALVGMAVFRRGRWKTRVV